MKIAPTISVLAVSSSLTYAFTTNSLPSSSFSAKRHDTKIMYHDDKRMDETSNSKQNPFIQDSPRRIERFMREHEEMNRFAHGQELKNLRDDVLVLKDNLRLAMALDDLSRIVELKRAIEKIEKRDPELVYAKALQKIEEAKSLGVTKKYRMIAKQTKIAESARKFIPRLNFEGLWVGSFGEYGSELINVTYSGDVLIATKVTGDKDLPRGEVAFIANLGPKQLQQQDPTKTNNNLSPVSLSGSAASKWGSQLLERYQGKGRTTLKDKEEYVEGQLIVFDGFFSFLWSPSRRHVFFSRPKPELLFHLLRDTISLEDEIENMREHLHRCYETEVEAGFRRPMTLPEPIEPFRRISREEDLVYAMEEKQLFSPNVTSVHSLVSNLLPPATRPSSLWNIHKWTQYLESILKSERDDFF